MFDGDVYLPSASSAESCDTSYLSNKEKIEVASTVQPYEGEQRASSEYFTDNDGFSLAVFRSRSEQKSPVTEGFVRWV